MGNRRSGKSIIRNNYEKSIIDRTCHAGIFPHVRGAKELFVDSPNGKISVTVSIDSVIAWSAVLPIPKL